MKTRYRPIPSIRSFAFLLLLFFGLFSSAFADVDLSNLTAGQISQFSSLDRSDQQKMLDAMNLRQDPDTVSGPSIDALSQDKIPQRPQVLTNQTPAQKVKPLRSSPEAPLKLFGYDIFSNGNSFDPTIQIPMPENYILGIGDSVFVTLYGKTSATYELSVTREGNVVIPDIGVVNVSGLTFDEARQELIRRIKKQMIGVEASVTMGNLRSMIVYIMGEVSQPGSYAVSSLSTITNALFSCGGIKETGSLRNVQLKRSGKLIDTLDLYKLLLGGDNSQDARLEPGDVIFVPPIGETASVSGSVLRPAIYELKGEKSVSDLLALAGGCRPDAYLGVSQMTRIDPSTNTRYVVSADLSKPDTVLIRNGDELMVSKMADHVFDSVVITGDVTIPRSVQWFAGMHLDDAIRSMNDVQRDADLSYVLVASTDADTNHISIRSTCLDKALEDKNSRWNLALDPMDQIIIFDDPGLSMSDEGSSSSRRELIDSIISQLNAQRVYDTPVQSVSVTGAVRYPGEYPLEKGMRVLDLLRAAHSIMPDIDTDYALLVRRDGNKVKMESLELPDAIDDESSQWNYVLQPRDELHVFSMYGDRASEVTQYLDLVRRQTTPDEFPQVVSVGGMIRHPGLYPFFDGMKVSDLIRAGGGFIAGAYTQEAEISRSFVTDNDKEFKTKHLSVNLGAIEKGDAGSDFQLKAMDDLVIRPVPEWSEQIRVTIRGEVSFPGTYTISKGESLRDLIDRAGGLTKFAFPEGAVFTRKSLKEKEQKELDRLRERLRADTASTMLQKAATANDKANVSGVSNDLLAQLETTKAVGRMTIDLPSVIDKSSKFPDIMLKDGDFLYVPKPQQEVTVMGEVMYPTSHVYRKGLNYKDYISMSGGIAIHADKDRMYVIKANGAVIPLRQKSSWFKTKQVTIDAGDSIIVPYDTEYISPLPLWKDVTGIIYNLAVSAAAIGSF